MIYDLGDDRVQTVGDDYFVAPNAAVIARVSLGRDASVWFNVVLRGDNDSIKCPPALVITGEFGRIGYDGQYAGTLDWINSCNRCLGEQVFASLLLLL